MNEMGFESMYLFIRTSRMALGLTQPTNKWGTGGSFPRAEAAGV
jgi:hypothetical protein